MNDKTKDNGEFGWAREEELAEGREKFGEKLIKPRLAEVSNLAFWEIIE